MITTLPQIIQNCTLLQICISDICINLNIINFTESNKATMKFNNDNLDLSAPVQLARAPSLSDILPTPVPSARAPSLSDVLPAPVQLAPASSAASDLLSLSQDMPLLPSAPSTGYILPVAHNERLSSDDSDTDPEDNVPLKISDTFKKNLKKRKREAKAAERAAKRRAKESKIYETKCRQLETIKQRIAAVQLKEDKLHAKVDDLRVKLKDLDMSHDMLELDAASKVADVERTYNLTLQKAKDTYDQTIAKAKAAHDAKVRKIRETCVSKQAKSSDRIAAMKAQIAKLDKVSFDAKLNDLFTAQARLQVFVRVNNPLKDINL